MTDAVVSVVVNQLALFFQEEAKLVKNFHKDVSALKYKFQMLQALLDDAETKQITEKALKLWLAELKAIAYDAEDVFDDYKVFSSNRFSSIRFRSRHNIGKRIKDIRERLDDVANDKEKFNLNKNQTQEVSRETSSVIDVSKIYGRVHDKDSIVNLLLDKTSSQENNTEVISIVGTGGFGKTTIANLVLEETDVKNTFEKRIFVCVSDPFNLCKVARSIIEQVTEEKPSVEERESLLKCLCETLKGKKIFIVLDDVWTEKANDWTPLKRAFDGAAQGSWIVVTTRNVRVAKMMHSKHTHNLAELSDEDSWSLFKHIAFTERQEELSKFEEIGKEIAAKCKGVPLSIKTVGSLMRSKKTKEDWNDVLTSKLWEIEEFEKEISPCLFMSYNPLPSNLKQCFMYCAIFPKDTPIHKDKLVKLWMAQGFLGSDGTKNLEKIGCDYFDDLAMHSFFQDFEKGPEGNITSWKMHDLVHDFALFLTEGECFSCEVGEESVGKKVRHLVTATLESSSIYMAEKLRTLLITQSVDPDQLIKVFSQLKYIRILDLSYSWIEELPKQVKKLFHLRYLDLSSTDLVELPKTICKLYNLQTLKLNKCTKLIKLPAEIGNLLNLRHLVLEKTDNLRFLPQGIGRLRYLQSLSKFIVGGASNGCRIRELKDLCNLQGSLVINGLERVADAGEAAQAELKNKSVALLSLVFESLEEEEEEEEEQQQGESENMVGVLENFQPHENVVELNICSFRGSQFPNWIMSANLLRLALCKCHYTTNLPALGNLASLEELALCGMKSVKRIGQEFYGSDGVVAFPKLKKLVIDDMEGLVQLELLILTDAKTRTIMPCLQKLILRNCPLLSMLPAGLGKLKSLERLEIKNLSQVEYIGQKFYGFDDDNDMAVTFPKLKVLEILSLNKLVEWELPIAIARDNKKIMPCLSELKLRCCPVLSALPSLGTLESLESLSFERLPSIKKVGLEFLGISGAADEFKVSDEQGEGGAGATLSLFPKLTQLGFNCMEQWEDWTILPPYEEDRQIIIMPHLHKLELIGCPKLVPLPDRTRFKSLKIFDIHRYVATERGATVTSSSSSATCF